MFQSPFSLCDDGDGDGDVGVLSADGDDGEVEMVYLCLGGVLMNW